MVFFLYIIEYLYLAGCALELESKKRKSTFK